VLSQFFQFGPIPADQMIGVYDPLLVILSYLVATFASYIALDFTGRLRDSSNTEASLILWLIGGSIAMGAGIWSMHFIGMLSFSLPMMILHYDLFWTGLSLFVAILASLFALSLLKVKVINTFHLAIGGIILGLGIASMHYTGMEAMKSQMNIHYLPGLFSLSILVAIIASEAALWLALKSNQVISRIRVRLKIVSALIMGLAICGMHYTAMFAAIFTPHTHSLQSLGVLDPAILSMSIAGVTFVILGIAFFASTYKDAINQQKLESARQLGMAEVAASVLHNVGNVLNSVNVSANVIAEKIEHSNLEELKNICILLNEHEHNLGKFITTDPRGMKILNFLNLLANYLSKEQVLISNEILVILKNLQHIKDIISMQQGLSKITGVEHIISIDELLNEALLITGLDNSKIIIDKKYERIKPIVTDKVKLLQILVNLMSNAKDALKESNKDIKSIFIKYAIKNKNTIQLQITDNGIGIPPENLNKIFSYGFSTKKTGHGYGLHTCALAINEMGGSMRVESEGVEKGATFTLELPYKIPR